MNIRQISSRAIRNEKKRGASFKDLCEKYQCTEEALEDVIRRFFYGGASEMIAELREVDKKRERRENHRSANSHPKDSVIPPPVGHFQASVPLALASSTSHPNQSLLTELNSREEELSNSVIKLESQHKALASQHRDCLKDLRQIYTEISTLKQQLEAQAEAYEKLALRNNEIVQSMNQISSQRRDQLALLESVRAEIKANQVIGICAYANGVIEPLEKTVAITLNETGSEELYSQLILRDDFQDLRLRDIRIIARLASIFRNSSDLKLEPCFENETLEPFFRSLLTA